MATSALLVLLTSQTYKGVRINLALDEYVKPSLGFMREIAVGVAPHGYLRYNMYKYTVVSRAKVAGHPVLDYIDDRIGDIGWDIKPAKEGQLDCLMLSSSGSIKQILNLPRSKEKPTWTNVARRWFWVGKDGKLLRDSYQLSTPGGAWTMDAKFREGQVDITYNTPTETRQEVLNPKDGTEPFNNVFKPMVSKGKKLMDQKTFQLLDPFTGAPRNYKAFVTGRFTSNQSNLPGKGYVVQIKGPWMDMKAFIRDDDELLKVELPNDRWIEGNIPVTIGGG